MLIENTKARVAIIFIVLFMSILYVVPNFVNVGEAWWLPSKKLNYGLDIQGGLHLVMGIDIDSVISEDTKRTASSVKTYLEEEKVKVKEVTAVVPAKGEISILLDDGEAVEKVIKLIQDGRYGNALQVIDDQANPIVIRYFDMYLKNMQDRIVDQAIETIRNRIDEFGVSEPSITAQGKDRILIQLPGIKDAEKAKQLINTTARLEFMLVDNESIEAEKLQSMIKDAETAGDYNLGKLTYSEYVKRLNEDLKDKLPKDTVVYFEKGSNVKNIEVGRMPYLLKTTTDIGGEDLKDAFVTFDQQFGKPEVSLSFNAVGAKKFADLTGANKQKLLAIVLDKVVKSAPQIKDKIAGGNAVITLGSSPDRNQLLEEAKMISMALRAGALPASLQQLEERTVGPTLGADSIAKGTRAGLVGAILVFLFMLVYYRTMGVIADLALAFNILGTIAALTSLGATLTLPGVAGIALTVGMAVDANIIIFERIKEELAKGTSIRLAIKEGFGRAFSAIFDSNITTAAVCVVLMHYGTGPIRGFAVTLIIGIAMSMFTAIFVSRTMLDYLVVRVGLKKLV